MEIGNCTVSIIVPVYNVEAYLEECLDSICKQSYSNIEIICVEDCSTDRSKDVLKRLALADDRIKCIFNDKNSGLSVCRNVGVENATGEFVLFVDSDDLLDRKAVEVLLANADPKTEIVAFELAYVDEHSEPIKRENSSLYEIRNIDGRTYFSRCVGDRSFYVSACTYFIRTCYLVNNHLRFTAALLHEDILFSFSTILQAGSISRITEPLYYYRKRTNSITTAETNLLNRVSSMCYIIKQLQECVEKETDQKLRAAMLTFLRTQVKLLKQYYQKLETVPKDFVQRDDAVQSILPIVQGCLYNGFFPNKLSKSDMAAIRDSKKVLIYGKGAVGKGMAELLQERGVKQYSFVVSQCSDGSTEEISQYATVADECVVIIASAKGQEEMIRNAQRIGFDKIVIPVF